MVYCGYIVKIDNLREHSNADRLMITTIFDNNVIVSKDTNIGDVGVFFPTDGQLSERFCAVNDLVRRKDENGNCVGGYLDPEKRNIRALKLRGERSEGLYLPITCLADFCTISDLKVGQAINVLNGEEICCKYIPRCNPTVVRSGEKHHKVKTNIAPTFYEHVDTEQLAYNLNAFKAGDIVQLTLKMHGTSGRTGYLPLHHPQKRNLLDILLQRTREKVEYGYITGTRRVVLTEGRKGGFYDSDDFRYAMAQKFEGKLRKGEVAYYEIVGFQGPEGQPIMPSVKNSKIKDKEFTKQYGGETVFSYGCEKSGSYSVEYADDISSATMVKINPCCDIYVYRMTMVNEDGRIVEYSPAQIKERCMQMNIHTVMEFETFIIPDIVYEVPGPNDTNESIRMSAGEYVLRKVEQYFDGPDPIGKTHVREGVVARILNRSNFAAYKHKNFNFKCLEGIAKDEATIPDIEEMQDLPVEDNEG